MQRADGFRFSLDRERFLVGRGILRDILSRYLKLAPELIGFSYNRYGKPALEGNDEGLRFNVSHSHGVALYGVTRARTVGLEIEFIREDFDIF
jgi:4'-phosphopantetheinyl transferase